MCVCVGGGPGEISSKYELIIGDGRYSGPEENLDMTKHAETRDKYTNIHTHFHTKNTYKHMNTAYTNKTLYLGKEVLMTCRSEIFRAQHMGCKGKLHGHI